MRKKVIVIIVIVSLLVIAGIFGFFFFFNEQSSSTGSSGGTPLKNPAAGLSIEEAAEKFDGNFVFYLLVEMGAEELHNPPLSSSTPKIQIEVSDLVFNAEISGGSMKIGSGASEEKDIIIRTTRTEAVKMMNSRDYVKESFNSGESSIELVAGKPTLFSKGYLKIYDQFKS
jgi:hypothetical protein